MGNQQVRLAKDTRYKCAFLTAHLSISDQEILDEIINRLNKDNLIIVEQGKTPTGDLLRIKIRKLERHRVKAEVELVFDHLPTEEEIARKFGAEKARVVESVKIEYAQNE